MAWESDLQIGKQFEREVQTILNAKSVFNKVEENADTQTIKRFDLFNKYGTKWECKCDVGSERTGNAFFELFNEEDEKTGILATWAHFVVYGFPKDEHIHIFQTPYVNLIKILMSHECVWRGNSGDRNAYKGVTIPLRIFCRCEGVEYLGKIADFRIEKS